MHYQQQETTCDGTGLHIGIIVAHYNWDITGALLTRTQQELVRLGITEIRSMLSTLLAPMN